MDRLLVGDVGFGKTEVCGAGGLQGRHGRQASRASSPRRPCWRRSTSRRSRNDSPPSRQSSRWSRAFGRPPKPRSVLRALAAGELDLVVGTHRLLSKDVVFKNLGLLVVDEEQRFGVAAKERLKQLSIGIDVLSMTATPIPRSLQMSLAGVRDLSIIETPPPGRSAIQTYLDAVPEERGGAGDPPGDAAGGPGVLRSQSRRDDTRRRPRATGDCFPTRASSSRTVRCPSGTSSGSCSGSPTARRTCS